MSYFVLAPALRSILAYYVLPRWNYELLAMDRICLVRTSLILWQKELLGCQYSGGVLFAPHSGLGSYQIERSLNTNEVGGLDKL